MTGLRSLIPKPLKRQRESRALFRELDELTRANRERPDPETERRILRIRHRAFQHLDPDPAADTVSASGEADQRIEQGLPVLDSGQLGAEAVRGAILARGSVHARGLVGEEAAERMRARIDLAFDAALAYRSVEERGELDGWKDDERAAWYWPFKPLPGYTLGGGRNWNRNDTSIWAADSPRLMFELLEIFERAGISEVVKEYLGERAAISMNKTVLRRVPPRGGGADWHQDGAFLGEDIRSLNVWLALSDCGVTAPGMDIVGRRLEEIVPTGRPGASFDWSVAPDDAERAAGAAGIVRPRFAPGDALLFDHLMLHRTAAESSMTETRYAIETWFFAPSAYPEGQVPLVL